MSENLSFNLSESVEFSFQLDIEGALATINSVRFVIIKNNLRLTFVTDYRDKNAIVKIENLEKFLDAGTYPCELEVYIGNQYFVPFQSRIELTKPIKISALPKISSSMPKIIASLTSQDVKKSEVRIEKGNIKVDEPIKSKKRYLTLDEAFAKSKKQRKN